MVVKPVIYMKKIAHKLENVQMRIDIKKTQIGKYKSQLEILLNEKEHLLNRNK